MSNKASLPELPYKYEALEPYISSEIMTLHHTKHHQAYVNGFNAAISAHANATNPRDIIALQAAIKFNGGGHVNHSLFWKNLAPNHSKGGIGGVAPQSGPFHDAIVHAFTNPENLVNEFNAATLTIQGSGWGWLVYNTKAKRLEIITTANQDPVVAPYEVIIGVDIWEHAFYLQYKNDKASYLKAIWNVINWKEAETRYLTASGQTPKL